MPGKTDERIKREIRSESLFLFFRQELLCCFYKANNGRRGGTVFSAYGKQSSFRVFRQIIKAYGVVKAVVFKDRIRDEGDTVAGGGEAVRGA